MTSSKQGSIKIFFSYAEEDTKLGGQLATHLSILEKDKSVSIWNHQTDVIGGENLEQEIESHLKQAHIILLCISADYLHDQQQIMNQAFERTQREPGSVSLIPILLRPCLWKGSVIGKLQPFPRNQLPVESHPNKDQALADIVHNIELRIEEIKQNASKGHVVVDSADLIPPSPPQKQENPYVGLRPFTFEENETFHGRERLVQKILTEIDKALQNRSKENRLIAVVGPSGAGKSSVINAGVLPRLVQGALPGSEAWTILGPFRPGNAPLDELTYILQRALHPGPHTHEERALMLEALTKSDNELRHIASDIQRNTQAQQAHSIQTTGKVVLVIDQFEELLTSPKSEEALSFIKNLNKAVTQPEKYSPLLVLLTFRSDFYSALISSGHNEHYKKLHKLMHEHEAPAFSMSRDELREAIERPLSQLSTPVHIAPELVDRLLHDIYDQENKLNAVQAQEDALPLLQFTLQSLFEHRQGDTISMQSYEEIGELEGALNKHADEVYDEVRKAFPLHYQELVPTLFLRLVTVSPIDRNTKVRRRVLRSDCELSKNKAQWRMMHEIIEKFINGRLLTTDQTRNRPPTGQLLEPAQQGEGTPEGEGTLEVSHEALLRSWKKLVGWIEHEKDDLLFMEKIDLDIYRRQKDEKSDQRSYDSNDFNRLADLHRRGRLNTQRTDFFHTLGKEREKQEQKNNVLTTIILCAIISILLVTTEVLFLVQYQIPKNVVTNNGDSGLHSLRQVLQDATSGDTITIDPNVAGKTIMLQSDLNFTKNIVLRGPGLILSSPKGYKIQIAPGVNVTFDHVTIKNSAVAKDGVVYNQGFLTLRNCDIDNNHSNYNGGALANTQQGLLSIDHSQIHGNRATGNGGAIFNWGGSVMIYNSSQIFDNQTFNNGGGLYSIGGQVIIYDSSVKENKALRGDNSSHFGGGIGIQNANLSLLRSTITSNIVNGDGGGISVLGGFAAIDYSTITKNTAINGQGGGIAVEKNSENNYTSQITISGTEELTNSQQPTYYIGKNNLKKTDPHATVADNDISGIRVKTETNRLTYTNKMVRAAIGNPPPANTPPEDLVNNFLGNINIDAFCLTKGYGSGEPATDDSSKIQCLPSPATGIGGDIKNSPSQFSAIDACKRQFDPEGTEDNIIDRLADYYDPSSWQCYQKVQPITLINGITNESNVDSFCKNHEQMKGIQQNNDGKTAYNWDCLDASGQVVGFSVTDLCRFVTHYKDAFDRLSNFNRADGWECWRPITS